MNPANPATGSKAVVVVGPFPPPVHGFAQATLDVAGWLDASGFAVTRIDLKPEGDGTGAFASLKHRTGQLVACWKKAASGARVYVALSGGKRQIVDLLFLAAAKFAKARIFVHHHSFAYLDHPNPLARVCMRVAGPQATHLVLCGKMKRDLQQYYRSARNVQVISNAALPSVAGRWRMRPNLRTVGYLSALTQEKGIYTFLEIAERLAGKFPSLNFVIAGPCSDPSVLARVSATSREYPQITYAGPVYGDSKTAYLDSIDALLFPTTYKNEAEPLVIWEAISAGIPVLGWDRGCIGEMLTFLSSPSTAIEKSESFSDVALATLEHWLASPEMFRQASADMKTHFELSAKRSVAHLEEIFGLGQASRREEWAQA